MEATTTTFYHADLAEDEVAITIELPAHSDHVLHFRERGGCDVGIFLNASQLRQLIGAINERLGLVSRPADERLAGDNERCVVHGTLAEVRKCLY